MIKKKKGAAVCYKGRAKVRDPRIQKGAGGLRFRGKGRQRARQQVGGHIQRQALPTRRRATDDVNGKIGAVIDERGDGTGRENRKRGEEDAWDLRGIGGMVAASQQNLSQRDAAQSPGNAANQGGEKHWLKTTTGEGKPPTGY